MCQAPIFKSSKSDIYFFVGSFLCFFDKSIANDNVLCYNLLGQLRGIAQLVEQRSPKPRVESSILSAPAKKQRIIDDYPLFLCLKSLKYVILTLTKANLDRDQTYFSPLQCLVFVNTFSVCNDSVCYSIKKASICYYEYQVNHPWKFSLGGFSLSYAGQFLIHDRS